MMKKIQFVDYYLAGEAVGLSTDWAPENVEIVLDNSPAGAISCLAMESVAHPLFS
jgi:hypothetical protein